jgi:hypothetical protein
LLDEMLDAWERVGVDEVIRRLEGEGGDARAKLRQLAALVGGPSSEIRGLLRIDLAVRDWARRDKAVARRLRRADNRRVEYMRSLFRDFCRDEDDVEVRCLLFVSLFIGSPMIAADHGTRSRAEVTDQALSRLLA